VANFERSSILGGSENVTNAPKSTISGGLRRLVGGDNNWRAGALFRTIRATRMRTEPSPLGFFARDRQGRFFVWSLPGALQAEFSVLGMRPKSSKAGRAASSPACIASAAPL